MSTLLDIILFAAIAFGCWRGYQQRRLWFVIPVYAWLKLAGGKSFWGHFLLFGPATVGWLLLCHWVNTHGWHATAAGGMLIGMTIGLEAMRITENAQKENKERWKIES